MICKLISTNPLIPNQQLEEGQTLILGRNRKSKIKDLRCSRKFCKIQLKNKKLYVEYLKSGKTNSLKSGKFINGPGFSYRIVMIENKGGEDDNMNKSQSKPSENIIWHEYDSGKVLVGSLLGGGNSSTKIAGFDYDFTLVCTNNGKLFPTDEDDWKLYHPLLPQYINQLVQQKYRFVVFSNQLGISKGKVSIDMIKNRFNKSLKKIGAPCLILIATQDDIYRKPCIGLWEYLQQIQPEIKINLKESFFVGDAAGRKKTSTQKANFSSSDLLFSLNAGLNFLLPEQFVKHMNDNLKFEYQFEDILRLPMPQKCFKFIEDEKSDFILENRITGQKISDIKSILPSGPHCIIFCGISGSGKTTFYQNYLKSLDYVHINLDELKSTQKCISLARKSMKEKRNCIIDNTNIDKCSRMQWINLCAEYRFQSLIFYFNLSLKHIFHNNRFRHLTKLNKPVNDVVIYTQNKKFEPLTMSECPDQFLVNFRPKFSDPNHERLYSMYLIEK